MKHHATFSTFISRACVEKDKSYKMPKWDCSCIILAMLAGLISEFNIFFRRSVLSHHLEVLYIHAMQCPKTWYLHIAWQCTPLQSGNLPTESIIITLYWVAFLHTLLMFHFTSKFHYKKVKDWITYLLLCVCILHSLYALYMFHSGMLPLCLR